MRLVRGLAGVAVVVLACEAAPATGGISAPVNVCADSCPLAEPGSLAPARCISGACVTDVAPTNFSLVVQIPVGNFRAPGMIFALSPSQVTSLHSRAPASCAGTCLPMPSRSGARGVLQVGDAAATQLWPPSGLCDPASCAGATTLPVVAQFEPRWRDAVSDAVALPALFRGIPIAPTEATSTPVGGAPGPGGGAAIGYEVFLQGTSAQDGLVDYRFSLRPLAPFDSAFPPFVASPSVSGAAETVADLRRPLPDTARLDTALSSVSSRKVTFGARPGAPSLAGFRAQVVSWPGGHRISNVMTLAGASGETFAPYVARSAKDPEETQLSLLLTPPDDAVALPSLVVGYVGGDVQDPVYPKVPAPVRVEGLVVAQGVPTPAALVFDVGLDVDSNVEAEGEADPFANDLTYRVFAQTDEGGAYSVLLPPGRNYTVWITPRDPALARTRKATSVASTPAVQRGRSLAVGVRAHVRGRAVTFDGRPVAGGIVVATPSADRYVDLIARDVETASLSWPRETASAIDEQGRFDLAVDPGEVDITVRPAEGSRFPWQVSLKHPVVQTDIDLPDLIVAPPLAVPWRLTDDSNNPIPRAIVSAYMLPRDAAQAPAREADGALLASRLVGRALTDGAGRFQLYLPPQLCATGSNAGGSCH